MEAEDGAGEDKENEAAEAMGGKFRPCGQSTPKSVFDKTTLLLPKRGCPTIDEIAEDDK